MYVSNRLEFGHLVNSDNFETTRTHPDLYQLFDNKFDWEKRYLHVNYSTSLEKDHKPIQVFKILILIENGITAKTIMEFKCCYFLAMY